MSSMVEGKAKRGLLVAENWPPRVGGIENYLVNIVMHLDGQVDVVAPIVSNAKNAEKQIKKFQVYRRKFFRSLIKPAWLPLYWWVTKKIKQEKYEYLLCGKGLFEGLLGYYAKKRLGIPYIVFTYAMEIETWHGKGTEKRKLKKVLREAHRVIYINDETKQTLLGMGVSEKQLVKIWPGVEDRFFEELKEKEVDKILDKYELKRPYILVAARLVERKGIDVLIEAFSQLDQTKFESVELVVVGDGPRRSDLAYLAEKLWVDTSVHFLGYVGDDDLPALFSGAELFAMTPIRKADDYEGFGIVYLEAAACGKASIATDTGGAKEAVLNNETGLVVKQGSVEETKQALEKLLSDKSLREKLGEQAKRRAAEEFKWSKKIQLVKKIIESV